MATIAFINTGRYTSSRGNTSFSDPVHLVAMHNLAKQGGYTSRVFQLGSPTGEQSIEEIYHYNPDILGLSFLAPFKGDIELVDGLLSLFRNRNIKLFLGGPDIQFDPKFYISRFGGDRINEWAQCVLVDGPGERLVETLLPHNFDIEAPEVEQQLTELGGTITNRDGVYLVRGLPEVSLDEQNHSRDYDLSQFQNKAGVKWATGCWAACSFCPNIPGKSKYKAPALVAEEMEYLRSLGAQKLDIASPQFTAHPKLASGVVGALPPDTLPVFFSSRVDSLFHAITRYPDEWKRFANSNTHGIGLGVDSFLPEKLVRMRKYNSIAQARQQDERLHTVLSFFSETRLNIVFYMITFEWQMCLEEVQLELEALMDCLNKYSSTLQIAPENVTNVLSHNRGSHFAKTMKPIDFLRFERDPRLFVMLYSMYSMHELMEDIIIRSEESHELMEAAAARLMVKFGLKMLKLLCHVPSEQANFETSFATLGDTLGHIFMEGQDAYRSERVLDQLLDVYPPKPQKKLRKFIAKEEKTMEKSLLREYDILLTRKVLFRMKQEGKMDERTLLRKLRKYQ